MQSISSLQLDRCEYVGLCLHVLASPASPLHLYLWANAASNDNLQICKLSLKLSTYR